jgi:hypothetical protein
LVTSKGSAEEKEFIHGNPIAIDDSFVIQIVECIEDEHEAWIEVFNQRTRAQLA